MTFIASENGVEYYSFSNPEFSGVVHGFFTRKGGVSERHFRSLNLGGSIDDEPEHVTENKHRVLKSIGRTIDSLYEVWQVHGNNIVCTDSPLEASKQRIKADGIFTTNPEVTLLMRFADCVPILLYDPVVRVVGIVHAGWQGTVNRIVMKAVERIIQDYGCEPADIIAGIGPSIGPDHYEIGEHVINQVKHSFSGFENDMLITRENKVYMDLWQANSHLLTKSGVRRIVNAQLCTACDTTRWYSHRVENGLTGRFAAVVGLKEN